MFYIKPQWRKGITMLLILIGGLGWANLKIINDVVAQYPFLRAVIAVFLIIYALYGMKGGLS